MQHDCITNELSHDGRNYMNVTFLVFAYFNLDVKWLYYRLAVQFKKLSSLVNHHLFFLRLK